MEVVFDTVNYNCSERDRDLATQLHMVLDGMFYREHSSNDSILESLVQATVEFLRLSTPRFVGWVRASAALPSNVLRAGFMGNVERLVQKDDREWLLVWNRARELFRNPRVRKTIVLKYVGFLFQLNGLFDIAEMELEKQEDIAHQNDRSYRRHWN